MSLTLQQNDFPGHLTNEGHHLAEGDTMSRAALLEVEQSITDRFAVSIGIPFVATRNGDDPSPVAGRTGVDDGQWHSTWQDWRLSARYNVVTDPVVLTPFVSYVFPSHPYQTRAEAAPGRDLDELIIGVFAGRLLSSVPNTYLHGRVSYAFVEELNNVSTDRTNASLSVGHFLTPYFSLSLSGSIQDTHGGLADTYVFGPDVTEHDFLEHDRILADDNFRVGIAAGYSINDRWSLSGGFATVVSGSNSHYGNSYFLGWQWTLRSRP